MLSGGMDRYVKIWDISFILSERGKPHSTRREEFPLFSNNQIHVSYVDCVKWLGDICVSKGISKHIRFWHPDSGPCVEECAKPSNESRREPMGNLFHIQASKIIACEKRPSPMTMVASATLPKSNTLWYIPFSISASFLVAGTDSGSVILWKIRDLITKRLLFEDQDENGSSSYDEEHEELDEEAPSTMPNFEIYFPQAPLSYYGIPDEDQHFANEKRLIDKLIENSPPKPSLRYIRPYKYSPSIEPQILMPFSKPFPVRGVHMSPDERYASTFNCSFLVAIYHDGSIIQWCSSETR